VQEAKKASYGVNAEIADPTGVQASVPGGVAQQGEKSGPMTQGSGIKPYTKGRHDQFNGSGSWWYEEGRSICNV